MARPLRRGGEGQAVLSRSRRVDGGWETGHNVDMRRSIVTCSDFFRVPGRLRR
jgi:hypothetical protein